MLANVLLRTQGKNQLLVAATDSDWPHITVADAAMQDRRRASARHQIAFKPVGALVQLVFIASAPITGSCSG
jgi:hypothetical protein